MKTRALLTFAGISAVTISAAAYYGSSGTDESPKLLTAKATWGAVVQTVQATGTLEAVTTVQVGSQVSGIVKALHADFNTQVRKGQVIAELEPSLLQAQVDQTSASLTRALADLDRASVLVADAQTKLSRARQLWDEQLISRADLDTAESEVRTTEAARKSAEASVVQARAALNQNRVNLGHAIIAAPIDGVIVSRSVDVGQTVAASMSAPTLFVIANDLSQMRVNANIDESDIGSIAPGQQVMFQVDAYPDDRFRGTVKQVRLNPVVEQNVVSYVTVIDVPNPDLTLKPGMTANVTIAVAREDDVLRVPNSALRYKTEKGEKRVWTLTDGVEQPVAVQTGLSDGVTTAIVGGGLSEGMEVVTGVVTPQAATASMPTGSPFMPGFGLAQGRGAGTRPAPTAR